LTNADIGGWVALSRSSGGAQGGANKSVFWHLPSRCLDPVVQGLVSHFSYCHIPSLNVHSEKWQQVSNIFLPTPLHSISNYMASVHVLHTLKDPIAALLWTSYSLPYEQLPISKATRTYGALDESHPDYQGHSHLHPEHNYHCSSDKLQQLVYRHLFKLSKANLMGLGESLSAV